MPSRANAEFLCKYDNGDEGGGSQLSVTNALYNCAGDDEHEHYEARVDTEQRKNYQLK